MRMLLRSLLSLQVVCLAIGTLWAANDPFVGKWKVNPSKSKLIDEMRVEAAGENRYTFTFGPGQVDTVVADGSDQPALSGTTLSITVKGPNNWEVVRKMKDRTLLRAQWTLSEAAKAETNLRNIRRRYDIVLATFAQERFDLVLALRVRADRGNVRFSGTWDSESAKVRAGIELQVQPYEADGLSFKRSDEETPKIVKLDGNNHPDLDPNGGDKGTAYSGRRVNERIWKSRRKPKANYGHPANRAFSGPQDLDGDRAPGRSKQTSEHIRV